MTRFACCGFALLALLVAWPAVGQQLWGGVSVGATVADVERAYPTAHMVGDPNNRQNMTAHGDHCLLHFDEAAFGHYRGRATFCFANGRLTTDELGINAVDTGAPFGASDALAILKELRRQYGAPVHCAQLGASAPAADRNSVACHWIVGELFVGSLAYVGQPLAVVMYHRVGPSDRDLCHLYPEECHRLPSR